MLSILLSSFFEVARQGSVTIAAKRLNVSQPTVTSRIRQLEEAYGVALFHRRGSRLDLTETGVSLLPMAEGLMRHLGDADFALRNAGDLRTGHLRVGVTGPHYILSSIDAFGRANPQLRITLDVGNSQQIIDMLVDHRLDIAVSSHAIDDARLTRVLLARDPLLLVVHRNHPLARSASVTLDALRAVRLLLREEGSMTRKATEAALATAGIVPAPAMVIGSREAIIAAIHREMGCSLLPQSEVPQHPELRAIPFAAAAPQLSEYLYHLKERAGSRLLQAFLEHVHPVGG
ncbi:LysR substrate-binding domain-containing protein [Jeongeupia naejangsanensis]|uniref:LysR family transcriptional regulator n=1 Tax=Jeongeupia naejangsanensis TaxID=613195 RepID=A0ABS2BRJ4_9NEIS|nr:LysR substrate-binding domain-containing protein [Jeongeupia naejangsanensis]MBM3117424.1 LysR family transcriptional regulator [Jeongeupia naejangsanensis]